MTTPVQYFEGRLSDLLSVLSASLHGCEPGTWVSAQTHMGLTVSLMRGEDGWRVRVSRDIRPTGNEGWDRHHREVGVLRQHLGISRWACVVPSEPYAGACVEFGEPCIATEEKTQ